jgi:hypothetical protein
MRVSPIVTLGRGGTLWALAVILASGCGGAERKGSISAPEDSLNSLTAAVRPSQTGGATYLAMSLRYRNDSSRDVFVALCGGRPRVSLERAVAGAWERVDLGQCPAVLLSPVAVGPGVIVNWDLQKMFSTASVREGDSLRVTLAAYSSSEAAAIWRDSELIALVARQSPVFSASRD